jgi:hypothetical protein
LWFCRFTLDNFLLLWKEKVLKVLIQAKGFCFQTNYSLYITNHRYNYSIFKEKNKGVTQFKFLILGAECYLIDYQILLEIHQPNYWLSWEH